MDSRAKRKGMRLSLKEFSFSLPYKQYESAKRFFLSHIDMLLLLVVISLSLTFWFSYFSQGHHLAYNDAMSHLDISRRVLDNLTPGLAQLGSVWLPLLHALMIPTIWIDSFWQLGISAALISMTSYIVTCMAVFKLVKLMTKRIWPALLSALLVAFNTNFLYLQTTALTEPLFMATSTLALYMLGKWVVHRSHVSLFYSGIWIVLATLTRYDGWALLMMSFVAVVGSTLLTEGYRKAEGLGVYFFTIASFGVFLWFLWNKLIFGDAFYFAFGEFSAKSQQDILVEANDLPTKGNILFTLKTYYFAMISNIGFYTFFAGLLGWMYYMITSRKWHEIAFGITFLAPILFNIVTLYFGHSVIHLPEVYGDTWFNVRYGALALPWAAVFIGYLLNSGKRLLSGLVIMLLVGQTFLFHSSNYAVTLDDGLWGSSQKNVKGIGAWINQHIGPHDGLILVSVASHDAILFSSGLNMDRFIHEGAGDIWRNATQHPSAYADFVIMRTHDTLDRVSVHMDSISTFEQEYELLYDDEFADIYGLKSRALSYR